MNSYNRSQLSTAQFFKFVAPVLSVFSLIIMFIDTSKYFLYLTRPCAFYQCCDIILVFSVVCFTVISSLPIKIRFSNIKLKHKLVNAFITITMTAAVSYLFVEALDLPLNIFAKIIDSPSSVFSDYIIGNYLTNDIVRAIFFVLVFIKELREEENLRKYIIFTGFGYLFITFSYYFFFEHYTIGINTIAIMICVAIVLAYELMFYDLSSSFVFSTFKDRKFHIVNGDSEELYEEIDHIHVVSYEWRGENCLHLLTYASDGRYLDIWYEFLPEFFLARQVSFDVENADRFALEAEFHKLDRQDTTHTRI